MTTTSIFKSTVAAVGVMVASSLIVCGAHSEPPCPGKSMRPRRGFVHQTLVLLPQTVLSGDAVIDTFVS